VVSEEATPAWSLMALTDEHLHRKRLLAQLLRERDLPGPEPFDWPAVWGGVV